ncbi:SDR family oxidoreductase [Amycolatopsis sp. H20-H5]|uniref:SDR family oxidoreductase n=1 Tax=Amycolatopsis sp. H20-H5 TaxID=3046309 RepID=UPI002DBDDBE6|nr:NAD(P)H-binding protein [Amycolatopsis sp. H20-H5]MEC3976846.1 NAD(P)H-binding protein [Amycolatopsis sp. H20-H5]
MTKPILVTGGTGTLGREVVRRLLAAGQDVRVLSRHSRPEADREPYAWATGDLSTGAGLDAALAGTGTIVHCATAQGRHKDVEATRALVDAAKRAGGPHLVYISIVGIEQVPFSYYRAKVDTERVVEDAGLPWTILRATQFHDLVTALSAAQRFLPVTLMPAGFRFQPIDAGEVAGRLVDLATGSPAGRVPDLGGPEILTARALAKSYLEATGRRRVVVSLPLPGAAARAVREGALLTPGHADGKRTYTEFLRDRFGRGKP